MKSKQKHEKLGQLAATAICGNDILSSALYVSGIAILFAGIYAPLVLLAIGFVLYLYKKVYTEVVEALPVNGGAYNCLLNGTSKIIAATAGIMTLLSYVATAVISAKVGVEYLNKILLFEERVPEIPLLSSLHIGLTPVILITLLVLFSFAMLVISGVKDSARVAIAIFVTHVVTLTAFLVLGLLFVLKGEVHFAANAAETGAVIARNGGLLPTLYLAFSASLLGVSGFESSANFVEEQEHGVFRKTLRNMLVGVTIFNPLIALVVLQGMPYGSIIAAKDFLLADAALAIGGHWFQVLVSIDAFLVLCGAVLTAYVGVSGLLHRMSADGCIPSVLSKKNSRGSFPRIVLAFFVLCGSILVLTNGDLLSLAGVYTIAFLGVMTLFALGNLVLREARHSLKRTYRAPLLLVILAMTATAVGILGNIRIDPDNLLFFEIYFLPALLLVLSIIYQDYVLKFTLRFTKVLPPLHRFLERRFRYITEGQFVVFIHKVGRLQPILDYINRNETGRRITLIHCSSTDAKTDLRYRAIADAIPHLHNAGFYRHLHIELLHRKADFNPRLIDTVSKELHIPKNRIFIGSIHSSHSFDYAALGGVRIIFG